MSESTTDTLQVGDTLRNGAIMFAKDGDYVLAIFHREYVTWYVDAQGFTYWGNYTQNLKAALANLRERAHPELKKETEAEKFRRIMPEHEGDLDAYERQFLGDY